MHGAITHKNDLRRPQFENVVHVANLCVELARRTKVPIEWSDEKIPELLNQLEAEMKTPIGDPTPEDWELLGTVASGESPGSIATKMGLSVAELTRRMTEASKKLAALVSRLGMDSPVEV